MSLTYYLPTYYQGVHGADALLSGIQVSLAFLLLRRDFRF